MSDSIDATGQDGLPNLLGVSEAAALLRVGLTFADESTAWFIATGSEHENPAIKVGRLTRVAQVALERFVGTPITWPIPVVAVPAVRPSQSARSGVSPSGVHLLGAIVGRFRLSPPLGCSGPEAVQVPGPVSRRGSGFRHAPARDQVCS